MTRRSAARSKRLRSDGPARRHIRSLRGVEALEARRLLTFDPSPMAQAFLEDINRMRVDPQGELEVLFSSLDPLTARDSEVQRAIDYFDVDSQTLVNQWSSLEPVPPVAWNEQLSEAAELHNQLMLSRDQQSHQLPGELSLRQRILATGYPASQISENVYAFVENHIHGHAGFVVDWGSGPGGIQSPPGHRNTYMDGDLQEVGIDVIHDTSLSNSVGPYLVTEDFANRTDYQPQVVGVVFGDSNGNGIYDPGEGTSGLTVVATSRQGDQFSTTTMTAGGYQLEVPNGVFDVSVSGPGVEGTYVVGSVRVNDANAKADFELGSANRAPVAIDDNILIFPDEEALFTVTSNDYAPSGNIVANSVTIIETPEHGSIQVDGSGRIRYEPDGSGSDDLFRYTIRDTRGATSNVATVNLVYQNEAVAPVAQNGTVSIDANNRLNVAPWVTDANGDIDWNTLRAVAQPAVGSITTGPSDGLFVYTPPADGVSGSQQLEFAYQVSDRMGLTSNVATISFSYAQQNCNGIANADTFAIVDRQPVNVSVIQNDVQAYGAATEVQLLGGPSAGAASLSGQLLHYIPPATPSTAQFDELSYRWVAPDGECSRPATAVFYLVDADKAWTNPVNRFDVNGDQVVSPIDALLVINQLGDELSSPSNPLNWPTGPPPFVDVDTDFVVSPLDALLTINALNGSNAASSAGSDDVVDPSRDEPNSTPPMELFAPNDILGFSDPQHRTRGRRMQLIDRVFADALEAPYPAGNSQPRIS